MARADYEEISPGFPLHVRNPEGGLEEIDAELRHQDVLGTRKQPSAPARSERSRGLRVGRVRLDHAYAPDAGGLEEVRGRASHHPAADDRHVVLRRTHALRPSKLAWEALTKRGDW